MEWIPASSESLLLFNGDTLCRRLDAVGLGAVREFLRLPVEHWVHLRTTNPLESVFSALYLVFKVVLRLSERWRPLNRGRNLMGPVVDGARFNNGILDELPASAEGAIAS